MKFDGYSDTELAERYVSLEATITDPVTTDLSAMSQQREVGRELDRRGVPSSELQAAFERAEDDGQFEDPLP